ncbi:hypothetical protein AG0111_0g12908 [Alternaria gaisen]|uniref:Uncharacterized protein n=1 Tax=Alternaria gaisen TaxID=167740 RepID=A0ACB6F3M0_9PLEO|nr:hypothetical protein AG0111_0g12908 [Alternaria gaisen]
MAAVVTSARNMAESGDRDALQHEEEAVEVASQWAQEKLENFLASVENSGNDHKLLKISYIISRRMSIDVFSAKSSDLGDFVKQIIGKLADGKVMEGIAGMAGTVINKLFGSASGSAQTERFYEVTFDELGGLNRVDAFFFCYRFASSGLTNFSKAVIGTCIVRSAASMVDDNAYRVVLTSSATLSDESRKRIAESMVGAAKYQSVSLDEDGKPVTTDANQMEARAILAGVIGEGVATSDQYVARRNGKVTSPFKVADTNGSAESQADKLAARTSTLAMDDKPAAKQIDAVGA